MPLKLVSDKLKMMVKKLQWRNTAFLITFIILFTFSLYLKLIPTLNYNFPFTMDQARDMLDIRAIVELKKPTLIGPTTSINGVFLGPFYYYFNLLPYIVSGGDPAALTYWNIVWYMIAGITLFVFFYKRDRVFGLLSSIIFLMAPAYFYSSRYFWSANPMPFMTIFYFLSIINFLRKPDIFSVSIVGLVSGYSMHFEAAFGVLFLPFFLIFCLAGRLPAKLISVAIGAFAVTALPQILFELRHDFIMSKTFFYEVLGKSQILGEKLTPVETFQNHFQSFVEFSAGQLEIPSVFSGILLIISFTYLGFLYFKKQLEDEAKNLFIISSSFVLFTFIFYMFYSYPLKGWYLLGLRIPYIFLIALSFSEIFKLKFPLFKFLVVFLLCWSFIATFIEQSRFIPKSIEDRSLDKSNLRNEIEAIDWVYEKADGRGFKAYNYIPSVYDFPYQYLYWWHGGKKYGYHPEVVTYLDEVPEYIQNNGKFLTLKKPAEDSAVFLIYEPDQSQERLFAWLGNFTNFCTVEKKTYPWGTTVELRKPCPN